MTAQCGRCGGEFEFTTWGEQACPHCGTRVVLRAPAPEAPVAPVAPEVPGEPLPWERRGELGLVPAYLRTVGRLLGEPKEAFSGVGRAGFDAFLFAAITWGLIGVSSALLMLVIGTGMTALVEVLIGDTVPFARPGMAVATLFAVPVVGLIQVSVWALLTHLGVLVTGANRRGLEGTFTAVAYGQTPNLLSALPLIGWAAQFWAIGLVVYGVKRVQDTSTGKALVSALWPVVLGVVCASVALGLLMVRFAGNA